jgi:hypothetical protein
MAGAIHFLVGCMGARMGLVYLAYVAPMRYLRHLGALALVVATGFAMIYINGWRKTGIEVDGGRIWWNNLRPMHAALWFLFALLALCGNRFAWVVLFADALLGLGAYSLRRMRRMA